MRLIELPTTGTFTAIFSKYFNILGAWVDIMLIHDNFAHIYNVTILHFYSTAEERERIKIR